MEMLKIRPNIGVNELRFGSTESQIVNAYGKPIRTEVNNEGETELIYPELIFRLAAATSQLREITLLPMCAATLDGTPLDWSTSTLQLLSKEDDALQLVGGSVVSVKLGIALTGFDIDEASQMAIHVFQPGSWDDLKSYMRPFKP